MGGCAQAFWPSLRSLCHEILIEKMSGKAEQRQHQPQPREIAIKPDAPWGAAARGITAC
jgi:hypothetical protein